MIDIREHGGIYGGKKDSGNFGGIGDFQTMFEPYSEAYPKIIYASERRVNEMLRSGSMQPSWIHLYTPYTAESKGDNVVNLGGTPRFSIIGEGNVVATRKEVYQLFPDEIKKMGVFNREGKVLDENERGFMSVDKTSNYLFGLTKNNTLAAYKREGDNFKEIDVVGDASSEKITGSYGSATSVELIGNDRLGYMMFVYNSKGTTSFYKVNTQDGKLDISNSLYENQPKSHEFLKTYSSGRVDYVHMKEEGKIVFLRQGTMKQGVVYDLKNGRFTTDEPYEILEINEDIKFKEVKGFNQLLMGGSETKETKNGVYSIAIIFATGSGYTRTTNFNFIWDKSKEVFVSDFDSDTSDYDRFIRGSDYLNVLNFTEYPNINIGISTTGFAIVGHYTSGNEDVGLMLVNKNAYDFLVKTPESALATDMYLSRQEDSTYGIHFAFESKDTNGKLALLRLITEGDGKFGLLMGSSQTLFYITSEHVDVAYAVGKSSSSLETYVQPMFKLEGNTETGVVRKIKRVL